MCEKQRMTDFHVRKYKTSLPRNGIDINTFVDTKVIYTLLNNMTTKNTEKNEFYPLFLMHSFLNPLCGPLPTTLRWF